MMILIYTDNVSNNHVLYYALGRLRGKRNVFFVNANEILSGALTDDVDLLVMPGGASRYKSAKLNGQANQLIKDYVANGGKYLGICAGSYMACAMTYWAKGGPYEIITPNELGFFSGAAVGPIEQFGEGDNYNSTKAYVTTLDYAGRDVPSLYLGGCLFEAPKTSSKPDNYQVLARFNDLADKPAAIIAGDYGQGAWLLSSTHPEYDQEAVELLSFDVVGNDYQEFNQLAGAESLTLDLLDELLKQLAV